MSRTTSTQKSATGSVTVVLHHQLEVVTGVTGSDVRITVELRVYYSSTTSRSTTALHLVELVHCHWQYYYVGLVYVVGQGVDAYFNSVCQYFSAN